MRRVEFLPSARNLEIEYSLGFSSAKFAWSRKKAMISMKLLARNIPEEGR